MKFIALDFDGVCNSDPFLRRVQGERRVAGIGLFEGDHGYMIDPANVRHVNTICERTGAVVVVSSTWRLLHTPEELERFLRGAGFTGQIVGATPALAPKKMSLSVLRGDEIQAWIDSATEPVESFVILDDSDDMGHLRDRLVRIDPEYGMMDYHVEKAVALLGVQYRRAA